MRKASTLQASKTPSIYQMAESKAVLPSTQRDYYLGSGPVSSLRYAVTDSLRLPSWVSEALIAWTASTSSIISGVTP